MTELRLVGRPPRIPYSKEIAQEIYERMIEGRDLVSICRDPDMPPRSTVYDWMEIYPDFRTHIARAREGFGDYEFWRIGDIAEKSTPETAAADRVKIAAFQWRASKIAPKKYGDKLAIGGAEDMPAIKHQSVLDVSSLDEEELRALEKALKGQEKADGG